MSQPDLFVVCKNCGSEVSPYVTECPYCGQRVRKRAPKLEREDREAELRPKVRGPRMPSLSRLRPSEIEGIAPDTRPVVTLVVIAISLLVSVVLAAGSLGFNEVGALVVPIDEQPWRYVTTLFVHDSLAYQFVALVAVGVFGTMLERRFGWFAPLLVFLAAGAAGAAAAVALGIGPVAGSSPVYVVLGANGSALGMLAAWLVDDRLAARRGEDRGSDLLGAAVFAAVLVLLPVAVTEADPVAGIVGAAAGVLIGAALALVARR
ncbi:MAG: rhomboid family intramembrane serine protease [Thermoleophilaceae bacterium]